MNGDASFLINSRAFCHPLCGFRFFFCMSRGSAAKRLHPCLLSATRSAGSALLLVHYGFGCRCGCPSHDFSATRAAGSAPPLSTGYHPLRGFGSSACALWIRVPLWLPLPRLFCHPRCGFRATPVYWLPLALRVMDYKQTMPPRIPGRHESYSGTCSWLIRGS